VQGEAGSAPRAAPTRVSHVAVTGRMLAGGALGAAPRVTASLPRANAGAISRARGLCCLPACTSCSTLELLVYNSLAGEACEWWCCGSTHPQLST